MERIVNGESRIIANVYVKKAKHTYWVNEYMRQIIAGKSESTALRKSRIK